MTTFWRKNETYYCYDILKRFRSGDIQLLLSKNYQNLDPPPPCSHLSDFGISMPPPPLPMIANLITECPLS